MRGPVFFICRQSEDTEDTDSTLFPLPSPIPPRESANDMGLNVNCGWHQIGPRDSPSVVLRLRPPYLYLSKSMKNCGQLWPSCNHGNGIDRLSCLHFWGKNGTLALLQPAACFTKCVDESGVWTRRAVYAHEAADP